MSFGRGDLTNPVAYDGNSYQNSDQYPTDSYNRLVQQTSSNILLISQNVEDIKRQVNLLGSHQDTNELRERLRQKQHDTNQISKDTAKYLKELKSLPRSLNVSEQRSRRSQVERLVNSFSEALSSFQYTQREAASAGKEVVARARAASHNVNNEPLIEFQPGLQQQQQSNVSAEDLQLVEERETAIRQLEADIVDVNMIFKDLAHMVHEQGDLVDSIEANVEAAGSNVMQGNTQLAQARQHQSSARKKKFFCFILLIVAIIILILVIYFSTKK